MRISGLWPALLTPLTEDGSIDHPALTTLAKDLVLRGIDGLVPLGSTGEFTEFNAQERRAILETVVIAADRRVPILAGVSGLSTAETCDHGRIAAEAGVDAVLALPPVYWKVSDDRIFDHFVSVADATDLPVVVYDFPGLTAQPLTTALLERLAVEEPRVIGAKLTVRDVMTVTAALGATRPYRPDFSIVTGFEDLIPAAMWAGADGAISGMANVIPDELVMLVASVKEGRPDWAELHHAVMADFDMYGISAPAIPGLKAAAAALGRIPRANWRLDAGPEKSVLDAAAAWAAVRQPSSERKDVA
ncbi:dihydrodipicolinate synthase family protein [Streptomyces sp. NBC_01361]|uniref:dihydrodipicolinate synthase family protein n=1 Tax=Streptomyces sp. NBC_01361 TaxID=2903838 RepID=UPI002E34DB99|nr:dihydrodipicolinate synthase family protein [Streptomyces sp. NBC_01361]